MLQIAICDDSQACIAEIYNYTESYFQQRHISASIDTFSSADNLLEKIALSMIFFSLMFEWSRLMG